MAKQHSPKPGVLTSAQQDVLKPPPPYRLLAIPVSRQGAVSEFAGAAKKQHRKR